MGKKKRIIIKTIVYAFFAVMLLCIQTTIVGSGRIIGVKPNLLVGFVVAMSIFEGMHYSAIFAFVLGYTSDAAFSSPFMISGILYFLAAYMIGYLSKYHFNKSVGAMMIFALPLLAVRGFVNVFYMLGWWSGFDFVYIMTKDILPELVFSAAVCPPVYFAVRIIYKIIGTDYRSTLS